MDSQHYSPVVTIVMPASASMHLVSTSWTIHSALEVLLTGSPVWIIHANTLMWSISWMWGKMWNRQREKSVAGYLLMMLNGSVRKIANVLDLESPAHVRYGRHGVIGVGSGENIPTTTVSISPIQDLWEQPNSVVTSIIVVLGKHSCLWITISFLFYTDWQIMSELLLWVFG